MAMYLADEIRDAIRRCQVRTSTGNVPFQTYTVTQTDKLTASIVDLIGREYGHPVAMPIETAPKDGTPILVFDPDGTSFARTVFKDFDEQYDWPVTAPMWAVVMWEAGRWIGYYSGISPVTAPTHWMPLPPPPHDGE